MEEHIVIEATRDFFLLSGALENDFCVNDINHKFIPSIIREQFCVSMSISSTKIVNSPSLNDINSRINLNAK